MLVDGLLLQLNLEHTQHLLKYLQDQLKLINQNLIKLINK